MLVWCKLASAKWEDAWVERLQFLGPTRLALFLCRMRSGCASRPMRLRSAKGDKLVRTFGGQLRQMKKTLPAPGDEAKLRPLVIRRPPGGGPLRARGEGGRPPIPRARPVLAIPAAMAFGTGDHATTSTCLRLLCDAAAGQPPGWEMLDLGTGTGILALAGAAPGRGPVRCLRLRSRLHPRRPGKRAAGTGSGRSR